jgi:hypothetical protein
VIFLVPGSYGETRELIEGYARHLRPIIHDGVMLEATARSSSCQLLLVDSSAPASTFETNLRLTRPAVDLTDFRYHLLLGRFGPMDSLGAEDGRLGSAVFVDWEKRASAGTGWIFHSLPAEMRNALRLLGAAALPAISRHLSERPRTAI